MGNEHADETLTDFKDGAIGDRVYLDGRVNSVSSSLGHSAVEVAGLAIRVAECGAFSKR